MFPRQRFRDNEDTLGWTISLEFLEKVAAHGLHQSYSADLPHLEGIEAVLLSVEAILKQEVPPRMVVFGDKKPFLIQDQGGVHPIRDEIEEQIKQSEPTTPPSEKDDRESKVFDGDTPSTEEGFRFFIREALELYKDRVGGLEDDLKKTRSLLRKEKDRRIDAEGKLELVRGNLAKAHDEISELKRTTQ